jgi:hypothetical protein
MAYLEEDGSIKALKMAAGGGSARDLYSGFAERAQQRHPQTRSRNLVIITRQFLLYQRLHCIVVLLTNTAMLDGYK